MAIDFSFDKAKKFAFSAVCKDLQDTVSKVVSVMGASSSQSKSYFILSKNKQISVTAYNADTACCIVCPNAKAESDGAFGLSVVDFLGLLKGRTTMDFEYTGNDLKFNVTKGKYKGTFNTLPVTDEQKTYINTIIFSSKEKKAESAALPKEILAALKEGMAITSVRKNAAEQSDIINYISFSEGQLIISASDNYHFGLYKNKIKTKALSKFKLALPMIHYQIIDRIAGEESAKISLLSNLVRVESANFLLRLPATQVDDKNFNLIPDYVSKTLKDPDYVFSYKHDRLTACVDNLITLNTVNTSFEIAYSKDHFNFTFSTQKGSASDAFKVVSQKGSKPFSIKLDPALLQDIISLMSGQAETLVKVKVDKVLLLSCTTKSGASVTLGTSLAG